MQRNIGGRITPAVIQDIAYASYPVETKAPQGPYFEVGRGAGALVGRPALLGRLGGPARVTVVSAPAGSGKTVLLRSWIGEAGLAGRAAWVPVGRGGA